MSWMWLVTAASLAGVVMNIYKYPMCFAVWCGTNLAWMVYDIRIGAYPQAAMFFVYLVTSVWGLWKWTREMGAKRSWLDDIKLNVVVDKREFCEQLDSLREFVAAMPEDSES